MRFKINTSRFGELNLESSELIQFPVGLLGFSDERQFALVDPGDDTLILWLQSTRTPELAFPVLEPRIFKSHYTVKLSAAELSELKLKKVSDAAVLNIITIPSDITQMTANLKAPLVIHAQEQVGKQVILQENEFSIKHPMFSELKKHLMTMRTGEAALTPPSSVKTIVSLSDLPKSEFVQTL